MDDVRIKALVEAFAAGKINRRQMLGRAAGLGVSAAALGGVLSGNLGSLTASAQDGGSELIVSLSGDIDTLDPHISQLLIFGNSIRFNVFSSLVRYSPTLEYLPDLAESWENPDDKTYRFTLREGVTYHDGTPVQASDVEFSFKRIAELETVFSGRVANIATYNVIDERTIEITLNEVQADFIDGLILLSIISPAIAENVAQNPIGTGPFKFVEWSTNDHISLARNENYFEEGVPGVDALRFNVIPEAQAAIANLESGAIQGIVDLPVAQAVPLEGSDAVTPIIVPTSSIHIFELLG
ncbi:MAG: ABC transporter substrate-binding protein, partial [Thermomicrobiales bacterium]|nr:ABC transporter substrate-binding protein [Thermomicrobiales bacterium]